MEFLVVRTQKETSKDDMFDLSDFMSKMTFSTKWVF